MQGTVYVSIGVLQREIESKCMALHLVYPGSILGWNLSVFDFCALRTPPCQSFLLYNPLPTPAFDDARYTRTRLLLPLPLRPHLIQRFLGCCCNRTVGGKTTQLLSTIVPCETPLQRRLPPLRFLHVDTASPALPGPTDKRLSPKHLYRDTFVVG